MLSVNRYYFRFRGKTAHAAADPHSGRSALDALELMNIGVNYLREHVTDDVRLHYAILSGGLAPNVVPDFAESYYYVRANEARILEDVSQRVIRVAKGAAMMTDTQVEIVYKSGSVGVLSNETLADLQYDTMCELGGIDFTDEEQAYAYAINEHFGDANVKTLVNRYGVDRQTAEGALIGDVVPSADKGFVSPGSSDMGDMSWYAPLQYAADRDLGEPRRRALLGCSRHRPDINRAQGHDVCCQSHGALGCRIGFVAADTGANPG